MLLVKLSYLIENKLKLFIKFSYSSKVFKKIDLKKLNF